LPLINEGLTERAGIASKYVPIFPSCFSHPKIKMQFRHFVGSASCLLVHGLRLVWRISIKDVRVSHPDP
jgi:hypothetical protein